MKVLIILYILIYIQLVIHELGHVTVALGIKLKIKNVNIGGEILGIRIRRMFISILPIGGYVEVYEEQLRKMSRIKIILFFEGGSIFNLVISLVVNTIFSTLYTKSFAMIGYLMVISNNIIFFKNNDLGNIINLLKNK